MNEYQKLLAAERKKRNLPVPTREQLDKFPQSTITFRFFRKGNTYILASGPNKGKRFKNRAAFDAYQDKKSIEKQLDIEKKAHEYQKLLAAERKKLGLLGVDRNGI